LSGDLLPLLRFFSWFSSILQVNNRCTIGYYFRD
jgi:hypothetical protein